MGHNSRRISGKPKEVLCEMKKHPRYKDLMPKMGESLVAYTLRYVGNVISPPQVPDESDEVECVDIRKAIKLLRKEIEVNWLNATSKMYG